MANKIIIKIRDNPKTNTPMVVVFEGIQYLSYSMESVELIWLEYPAKLNELGIWEPVISDIIVPRRIITPIDNANKVNAQGITITESYIKSVNVINTGETEQAYQIRITDALNLALSTGTPEFDFWIKIINWDTIISQGGMMLEQLKRFDRI